MEKFSVDPYLINGQHRITINLIGCGGTGALVLTKLARLNMALNHLEHPGFFVKAIDFDIVEEHNVGRQMFTSNDVGYHKSDVLIGKINGAFGFDWEREIRPYDRQYDTAANIIISAVDNVKTRKEVLDNFYKSVSNADTRKNYLLFDCGNARDYGQVIMCDHSKKLKNIFDVYGKQLNKQDNVEQQGRGCSYAESLLEQDIFINDWVSLYMITLLKDLLLVKEIDYQGFFFNTEDCATQKLMIK